MQNLTRWSSRSVFRLRSARFSTVLSQSGCGMNALPRRRTSSSPSSSPSQRSILSAAPGWRPLPRPRQRTVALCSWLGPQAVVGGVGTRGVRKCWRPMRRVGILVAVMVYWWIRMQKCIRFYVLFYAAHYMSKIPIHNFCPF